MAHGGKSLAESARANEIDDVNTGQTSAGPTDARFLGHVKGHGKINLKERATAQMLSGHPPCTAPTAWTA